MLTISENVRKFYPKFKAGILTAELTDGPVCRDSFLKMKQEELSELKKRHGNYERKGFIDTEPACFYRDYYKRYRKTYPVLLQLESVLLKGRDIPDAGIFVESMFLAEIKNLILTAGHDMDKMEFPLTVDTAKGGEAFCGITGCEQFLSKDDICLSDQSGIISSILNGPDSHSRIGEDTGKAMFFVYGTEGVSEQLILRHLNETGYFLSVYVPGVHIDQVRIFP